MKACLAAVAGSLCAMAAAAGATPAPPGGREAGAGGREPLPPGFVGVNVNGPMYPTTAAGVNLGQQLKRMRADGVESINVVFSWAFAQPYASWSRVPKAQRSRFTDAGGVPTDFQQTDAIVRLAAEHGLVVQPTVIYDPPWDATDGYLSAPADDAGYADFLTALIHRYGPNGSFWKRATAKDPITQWQIWNEPNDKYFWPKQPFAAAYVRLLKAAAGAIRAAEPTGKVVLGGLPDYSWTALKSIYAIPGAASAFDVVGVHPYTSTPAGMIAILSRVRQVMDAHGDSAKPIAVNEFGWVSDLGETRQLLGFGIDTTRIGQALDVARAMRLLAENRVSLGLSGFDYYSWATQERRGEYGFAYAGLLRYQHDQLIAKPALAAFRLTALALERRH